MYFYNMVYVCWSLFYVWNSASFLPKLENWIISLYRIQRRCFHKKWCHFCLENNRSNGCNETCSVSNFRLQRILNCYLSFSAILRQVGLKSGLKSFQFSFGDGINWIDLLVEYFLKSDWSKIVPGAFVYKSGNFNLKIGWY